MKTTNIYILIDPLTGLVRYVGKANNVYQRYRAHTNKARKHNSHKLNWINSLKSKGLKPIIEVIDIVPIEEWQFWETYWISQFKTWGFDLINYTNGGDGCSFGNQTSFKKGQLPWNTGKGNVKECEICGQEFKSCIKCKKRTCSKECSLKLKSKIYNKSYFTKGTIPWNKNKTNYILPAKAVIQMDLNGFIIDEFRSCKEASEKMNCNTETIRKCCVGENKTAKGFKWKYKINKK